MEKLTMQISLKNGVVHTVDGNPLIVQRLHNAIQSGNIKQLKFEFDDGIIYFPIDEIESITIEQLKT